MFTTLIPSKSLLVILLGMILALSLSGCIENGAVDGQSLIEIVTYGVVTEDILGVSTSGFHPEAIETYDHQIWYRVAGTIRNTADQTYETVNMTVSFYDEDSVVIHTEREAFTNLPSGHIVYFEVIYNYLDYDRYGENPLHDEQWLLARYLSFSFETS